MARRYVYIATRESGTDTEINIWLGQLASNQLAEYPAPESILKVETLQDGRIRAHYQAVSFPKDIFHQQLQKERELYNSRPGGIPEESSTKSSPENEGKLDNNASRKMGRRKRVS